MFNPKIFSHSFHIQKSAPRPNSGKHNAIKSLCAAVVLCGSCREQCLLEILQKDVIRARQKRRPKDSGVEATQEGPPKKLQLLVETWRQTMPTPKQWKQWECSIEGRTARPSVRLFDRPSDRPTTRPNARPTARSSVRLVLVFKLIP